MSDSSATAADRFQVIEGGNSALVPGSKAWATRVRKRAKQLVKDLDTGYLELARILYDVYDRPIDGDPNRGPIYQSWGFKSFAEWAEEELGLQRRTAERLRAIWYTLEITLAGIDQELKDRLISLGSSKLRELTRVLDIDNAAAWTDVAEHNSYAKLVKMIQKAKEAAEIKRLEEEVEQAKAEAEAAEADAEAAAQGSTEGDEGTSEDADGSSSSSQDIAAIGGGVQVEDGASFDDPLFGSDLPEVEEPTFEHFPLFPEQKLNVLQALQKAGEISGSTKKGHRLDLICTDFLANNDIVPGKVEENRMRLLAKMERVLGVKIIAIDEQVGEVVYGVNTLDRLAKS